MSHDERIIAILRKHNLRDTETRRMVVEALRQLRKPASISELATWIKRHHRAISQTTIYRIIDLLERLGIVHRLSCMGRLILCTDPSQRGAHALVHCHGCDSSQEFCSKSLQQTVLREAKAHGLKQPHALIELAGVCVSCAKRR